MEREKKEKILEELCSAYSELMYKNSIEELTCTSEEKALWIIAELGGKVNPKQLSEIMNVTMPRVTTLLNGMDRKGFITREVSVDDRRKVIVSITKKGKNTVSKINKRAKDYLSEILEKMTVEEGSAVLKYFRLRIEKYN